MSEPAPNHERNVAYAAFVFSGVVVLCVRALSSIPMDTGTAGGIGILMVLPAYLAALLAMVVGAGMALWVRRDLALLALAALAVAMIANFLLEFLSVRLGAALSIVYGVASLLAGIRWFLASRARGRSEPPGVDLPS